MIGVIDTIHTAPDVTAAQAADTAARDQVREAEAAVAAVDTDREALRDAYREAVTNGDRLDVTGRLDALALRAAHARAGLHRARIHQAEAELRVAEAILVAADGQRRAVNDRVKRAERAHEKAAKELEAARIEAEIVGGTRWNAEKAIDRATGRLATLRADLDAAIVRELDARIPTTTQGAAP